MALAGGIGKRKKSFVETFLEEQARVTKKTKQGTRMELARAENRKEKTYNNMLKAKQRAAQALEKLREVEAAHEAAREDVERLRKELDEEMAMDVL